MWALRNAGQGVRGHSDSSSSSSSSSKSSSVWVLLVASDLPSRYVGLGQHGSGCWLSCPVGHLTDWWQDEPCVNTARFALYRKATHSCFSMYRTGCSMHGSSMHSHASALTVVLCMFSMGVNAICFVARLLQLPQVGPSHDRHQAEASR